MPSYSTESILKMGDGRAQREEYESLRQGLSDSQEKEFVRLLSNPSNGNGIRPRHFRELANDRSVDRQIRHLMTFHGLDTKDDAKTHSRQLMEEMRGRGTYLEEDEVVEECRACSTMMKLSRSRAHNSYDDRCD